MPASSTFGCCDGANRPYHRVMLYLRSLLVILAGIVIGAVLSVGTDAVLEATGVFPSLADQQANGSPWWVLAIATVYRNAYTIVSGYVGAKIAPRAPMLHAKILGVIAVVANAAGGVAMWELGQHWYPVALAVCAFPCAWYGGKLAAK